MNKRDKRIDRAIGCLIGGAIGDALGYPVEHLSLEEIKAKYGYFGVSSFEDYKVDKALFSDDTQMTLFTANGIIKSKTYANYHNIDEDVTPFVYSAYLDWLACLGYREGKNVSWIKEIEELNHVRSPGRTCVSSLLLSEEEHALYNLNNPINDSKGSGAVMRIAPFGLVASNYPNFMLDTAKISMLTHGHPMSTLASQVLVILIKDIIKDDGRTLWRIAKDAIKYVYDYYQKPAPIGLEPFYQNIKKYLPAFIDLMKKTMIYIKYDLVQNDRNTDFNETILIIKKLGQGWVAEETLAIALYCAIRYQNEPHVAMRAAVNHDGDSDSTAGITGQILGTYHGDRIIPSYIRNKVEIVDIIEELARDLVSEVPTTSKEKEIWETKYIQNKRYVK